jgi:hypothetical protein
MDDFEVHPVGTGDRLHGGRPMTLRECMDAEDGARDDELARMTARALRAEGILAAIGRRLDDYRERGQAMPTYAEIVRLLQG